VTKVGQLLQSRPLTRAARRRDPPARQGSQHAERVGTRMKAAVMRESGGPEVLHYEEIETPKVGPDDVLVEVRAVSVNRTLDLAVWGGYARYVRVPAGNATPVPSNLSFHEATVIGRHLATAVNQVEGVGRVKAGDWVLVMGASGGLGCAAVQVAKWNGARVIAA